MNLITKPYFLQSSQWATFWKSAHDKHHLTEEFSYMVDGIAFKAIGYTYPWHFGQSFLYFPRFCVIISATNPTQHEIQINLNKFLNHIIHTTHQKNYSFIKLDTGFDFQQATGINTIKELMALIEKTQPNVSISRKSLQYLSTMVFDSTTLQEKNDSQTYLDFYLNNKEFWCKTNENVRRYTKKSCSQNWLIETSNTFENFEKFWLIYQQTAKKHDFGIHSKHYFETMMQHTFVRLITLSDENGVQSVWFGVVFDDTMYYLYGGNTESSFKKYGQYFIHLVATDLISKEGLMNYDLGGYDANKGFGKFKEGYRGNIVTALGPIDIILKPIHHPLTDLAVSTVKFFTSLGKKS
jgi:lipid II:glycine glycyltransferase (peptidoglycan interpeptide bridge formation enzyme)